MRPNLFRSVSNSLAERFPLLPRIWRSFLGLMLFCLLLIIIQLSDSSQLNIPVKSLINGSPIKKTGATYGNAVITYSHELTIDNPSIIERILMANDTIGVDVVTLFFLFVISLIVVLIIPKLNQDNLFRRDISDGVRWLGYLVIVHAFYIVYRDIVFIPDLVEWRTDREFTSIHSFPILMTAEVYFGLVLMALASIYKRGVKLQEEQDLTV